jgi:ATP-dependent protease ClpP protease subunit
MVGNIHIIGQIGTTHKEDGSIDVKGVELVDVISQIEPLIGYDVINVWINSGGGLVSVGTDIANYLSNIPNVVTIADGFCASIATKVHLAVTLANRKVVNGTQYMIHNPLLPTITNANADDLKDAIDVLEPMQKDLVKTYVDATGTSKEAIQSLMNVEASLTDEQLISLGFASEIINKIQLKSVAFIDPKEVNNKNTNMSKQNIKLSLYAKAMAMVKGREVVAVIQEVTQGTIETPFSDIMVGDPIMLGTDPAPADTYTLDDGTQLVVTEVGIVGEIITPAGDSVDVTTLMEEIVDLKEQIANLSAQVAEKDGVIAQMNEAHETLETEHSATLEVMNTLKAKGSSYTPPVNSVRVPKEVANTSKTLADRRAEIQARKQK